MITNLWETLTYTVSEIKVIEPNEIDEILIQPGRDLVTLLTCHPYGSGGRYRYVVYCEYTACGLGVFITPPAEPMSLAMAAALCAQHTYCTDIS